MGTKDGFPQICRHRHIDIFRVKKFVEFPPKLKIIFHSWISKINDPFYCLFEQIGDSKNVNEGSHHFFHVSQHRFYETCGSASHIKSI